MSEQRTFTEHLHDTGEITCPECAGRLTAIGELRNELTAAAQAIEKKDTEIAGLIHEIRSLSYKLEELKRDKEAEAREHDLWNAALDLFDLWRAAAGQAEGRKKPKGSRMSGDRFWLALPYLLKDRQFCQRAVIGRCFDHYGKNGEVKRANGSEIHYCEFERIFANRKEFEESVNRAPSDWKHRVEALGFEVVE